MMVIGAIASMFNPGRYGAEITEQDHDTAAA